jgi:dipeptidyl aminopeptidase/acylaminoacyl peptidase
MTPLPEPIVGAEDEPSQYAVSPEGSRLAYVAPDDDGTSQIFVADLDGSRVRQMTDDPIGADWPTWSPNGATIAYEGYGAGYGIGDVRNLARLEAGLPLRVRARVEAFEAARAKAVHRSKPAERVMKMLDAMRAESVA